jgi:hypothetical protein
LTGEWNEHRVENVIVGKDKLKSSARPGKIRVTFWIPAGTDRAVEMIAARTGMGKGETLERLLGRLGEVKAAKVEVYGRTREASRGEKDDEKRGSE